MRTPKCPYFAKPGDPKTPDGLKDGEGRKCGGCATQHLTYETQLQNKKERLIHELGGYLDIQVFHDEEWFYRNRMDMVFTPFGLGFREKGKWWRTLPVKQCVISNPKLNELITELNEFFGPDFDYFNVKTHEGTYKYATIRTPQNDSSVTIVLSKDSKRYDEAVERVKEYTEKSSANNVILLPVKAKSSQSYGDGYEVLKGSDMLSEELMGKTFRYSSQGFFQNNSVMANKMHEYVHGLLSNTSRGEYAHLLDLYGGVGAFGVVNADLFHKVTTLEDYEGCTIAARQNAKLNALTNVEAICMDAKRLKQVRLPEKELYVVTDPPRAGMHEETIIQLRKLKPAKIIYISCNVEQLGKDLPKFSDYQIKSAALFDLFPQTNHMESVVELIRC
jgi:23S rRNA (uracil-5-)-methyltransferase RumA